MLMSSEIKCKSQKLVRLMSTLEDVKSIDTNTRDLVNGYLKEIKLNFPINTTFHENIPSLVYYWCILYYYIIECFDPSNCHKHYTLHDDNTLITKKHDSEFGIAYLSKIVMTGIHRWKFKINLGNNYGTTITIGVWRNIQPLRTDNDTPLLYEINQSMFYGYEINGFTLAENADGHILDYPRNLDDQKEIVDGDIVEMLLDLNKMEVLKEIICDSLGPEHSYFMNRTFIPH